MPLTDFFLWEPQLFLHSLVQTKHLRCITSKNSLAKLAHTVHLKEVVDIYHTHPPRSMSQMEQTGWRYLMGEEVLGIRDYAGEEVVNDKPLRGLEVRSCLSELWCKEAAQGQKRRQSAPSAVSTPLCPLPPQHATPGSISEPYDGRVGRWAKTTHLLVR